MKIVATEPPDEADVEWEEEPERLLPSRLSGLLRRSGAGLISLGWFLYSLAELRKPGVRVLTAIYETMITSGRDEPPLIEEVKASDPSDDDNTHPEE